MQTTDPRLLTVPEAATQIGMSTRWMWDRVLGGDLPSVLLGNRRKVRPEDLDAFVNERVARRGNP
jgi:predicted DNA-binding transcriptional regulator AlpA